MKTWLARACMLASFAGVSMAQDPAPHAIDIPPWFATTFLDFREDVAEAAREGKRLMIYFGQDGCPYCKKLMTANFSQRVIVEKTRANFVAIALNMWGDRETTWIDGRAMSEKDLARALGIQFTPTILFLDEGGGVVVRLDGYWPPQRFGAVLDYVATKREKGMSLASWLQSAAKDKASPKLHDERFFLAPPYDLRRKPGGKPLAVIFETVDCSSCDELHREGFRRAEVMAQVRRFDVARFSLAAATPLTTPDGRRTTAEAWARELRIAYTPSVVYFDVAGSEVFRIGGYLRPFHLAASFAYAADGAYRGEPSFQRWLRERADRMRARGERVDLWE